MTASLQSDIARALRANPAALARFEALSPSHRKQYLEWISEAKRVVTRERRIAGMILRLTQTESIHGQA
ncbi:MAG TPA: YdeI/OmpD-associated family protein [Devosia sp.]|nr:YdeI/OmpD-associated family protein [Devosia sp.]